MFAMVMTFDGESAQETAAGVEHVQQGGPPRIRTVRGRARAAAVDRAAGQRMTVLVCDSEDHLQVGMATVQQARAKDPDRLRPAPTSVHRFEIYGSVP